MEAARLETVFGADTRELQAAYAKEQQLQGKSIQGSKNMAMQLAGGAGLLVASRKAAGGLFQLAQEASSLEETQSFTNVTFGEGADVMNAWGDSALKNLGMAKQTALEAANGFGGLFKLTGSTTEETVGLSQAMVGLAGDMASARDVPLEEALLAIKSGLIGEAEPMKRFNVLLSEARVKSFAYANGIASVGKELTEAQKVEARYAVIMADTADIQGDRARTSGSMANREREATEAAKDAAAVFGKDLATAMSGVYAIGSDVLGWLQELPPNVRNVVLGVGGLVTVVGPAAQGLFFMTSAYRMLRPVQAAATVTTTTATGALVAQTAATVGLTAAQTRGAVVLGQYSVANTAVASSSKLAAVGIGGVVVAGALLKDKFDDLLDNTLGRDGSIIGNAIRNGLGSLPGIGPFLQNFGTPDQQKKAGDFGRYWGDAMTLVGTSVEEAAEDTDNAALAMSAAQEIIRADARRSKGAFMDWRAGIRDATTGGADALAEMAGEGRKSFDKMRSDLDKQLSDVKNYRSNWEDFLATNPPKAFVKQLGDMGRDGAGILAELSGASNKSRKEWISDFLSIDKTTDRTTNKIVGYVGRLSGALSTADSRVKDLLASLGGLENIAINIHADVAIQRHIGGPTSSPSSGSSSPSPSSRGQQYGSQTQVFVDGERAQVRQRNRDVLLGR